MEAKTSPWILLAGGKSTRMGQPKGLLPLGEHTWLEDQLGQLEKYGRNNGILVLGFDAQEYLQSPALARIKQRQLRLQVVINPEPEWGPFSSIQTGIRALRQESPVSSVYVLPIDVPVPPPYVWDRLSQSLGEAPTARVVIPCFQAKGGHPVLLSQNFMNALVKVPSNLPTSRLDAQIHLLKEDQVLRIETEEPKILLNLNTPEDWNKRNEKTQ